MRRNHISHALSWEARKYLAKVFECTTFEHLMKLGEPQGVGAPNVFEENMRENPEDETYLDEEIASRHGFGLVRDYSIETICGRRVLLCHGDALCVNDASYHRMRAFLRHPIVEKAIRAFPAFLARAMARLYRAHSKRVVPAKSQSVLGLDEEAVREHFALGVDMIVCGHTHREGVSGYDMPEGPRPLYNLGDFGETGSFLQCARDGWCFRRYPAP